MQGVVLKASAHAREPHLALNAAADRIESQLSRYTKRLREHKVRERGGNAGVVACVKARLVLVEGDPSRNVADLRNVVVVMRDGRLMQASDLRAAVGLSGPPRR